MTKQIIELIDYTPNKEIINIAHILVQRELDSDEYDELFSHVWDSKTELQNWNYTEITNTIMEWLFNHGFDPEQISNLTLSIGG